MQIELVNIAELIPYEFNSRNHDEQQINRIANSIKEFGFNQPIVIDAQNTVIVGHGRLHAAHKLGLTEVPVLRRENLTEQQIKAYRILDNKLQNDSTWSFENLELDLGWLEDNGLNLEDWGLDDLTELIDEHNGPAEVTEDDYTPPDEINTDIKLGDLIELGRHRVLCGDSADLDSVRYVLNGGRPCMVFTDPPYGVSIGAKNRFLNSFQKAGRNLDAIKDDSLSPEELKAALLPAFQNIRAVMADDCTVFVCAPQGGGLGMMMMMMMQEADLEARHVLIWKKNQPTFSMGRLDYDYQHEPILLTWGKSHKRPMKGTHKTSVWEIDRERACKEHPTMKPVALVANALLNNSEVNDGVLDSFLGSGTTLIACEQLNRTCYGMEIEPKYCQVIIDRYIKHCNDNAKPVNVKVNGKAYYQENGNANEEARANTGNSANSEVSCGA